MKRQLRGWGIGSIFCFALLFTACESESFKEPESKNTTRVVVKTLSLEELENQFQVMEKLETILPGFRATTPFDGQHDFTLNTDEIVYIEKGNQHSYTFSIIRNDLAPGLETLVLHYKRGKNTVYRITYEATSKFGIKMKTVQYLSTDPKVIWNELEDYKYHSKEWQDDWSLILSVYKMKFYDYGIGKKTILEPQQK